jgi:hypothetical protein
MKQTICIIISLLFVLVLSQERRIIVNRGGETEIKLLTEVLEIEIKVEGSPSFVVKNRNSSAEYKMNFYQMYQVANETNPNAAVGGSNVALSSLSWKVSQFVNIADRVDFNMTSTSGSFFVQFRVKVYPASSNFKFDVVVQNYNSQWRSGANYLAFVYRLTQDDRDGKGERDSEGRKEPGEGEGSNKKEKVSFGKALFTVDTPFGTVNGTKDSTLKFDKGQDGKAKVILLYPKFGDWMIQDPTLGTSAANTNIISLLVVCVLALFWL